MNPHRSTLQPNPSTTVRLLVAASGTGGHLFPAIAIAEALEKDGYDIEWLGVRDRLETQLVPKQYPLNIIPMEGFQTKLSFKTLAVLLKFTRSLWQTRQLLKQGKFQGVLTTGGYIAAPAILAARSLGLPSVLHESNAIPGKVTRFLSRWCSALALGFAAAQAYLPEVQAQVVGTPVRQAFFQNSALDLDIPADAFVLLVMGGSQGARALNRLVRECADSLLDNGIWIVHLTGDRDPDAGTLEHPHYLERPFFDNMAGLLQRANFALSRSGAGTLTEFAITGTPSILIPYPYAAEDHQYFNAKVFIDGGAAYGYRESEITAEGLAALVLELVRSPDKLASMAENARQLAVPDSNLQCARLVQTKIQGAGRAGSVL
jgi:UDP-N-acetylglucosamine--N-acetylmuramyl-(pentapeptide) pyrophosphoryl-undecaprenol N-acetylglucosamine transferase